MAAVPQFIVTFRGAEVGRYETADRAMGAARSVIDTELGSRVGSDDREPGELPRIEWQPPRVPFPFDAYSHWRQRVQSQKREAQPAQTASPSATQITPTLAPPTPPEHTASAPPPEQAAPTPPPPPPSPAEPAPVPTVAPTTQISLHEFRRPDDEPRLPRGQERFQTERPQAPMYPGPPQRRPPEPQQAPGYGNPSWQGQMPPQPAPVYGGPPWGAPAPPPPPSPPSSEEPKPRKRRWFGKDRGESE